MLLKIMVALTAVGLLSASVLYHQEKDQRDLSVNASYDGRSVIFNAARAGGGGIYALDLSTSRVRELTYSLPREGAPAFSPDGRRIIYAAASGGSTTTHLYTYSMADRIRKRLTDTMGAYDDMASFSADGTRIVFARALFRRPYSMGGWTWDHWDIYVMRSDGTGLRRLTSEGYYSVSPPRFAPDGSAIVFGADPLESGAPMTDVFRVDLAGESPPKPLTRNGHSAEPVYTPDGRHIVYVSDAAVAYDYEIWSMDGNGGHPAQLTRERSYLENPLVLPDGKHFLALSDKGRAIRYDLYEFDIDGTHPRRLAASTLFDDPLHWKPER